VHAEQLELAMRPVPVKYVPAKQDRQAADVVAPVPDEYVPAMHLTQLAPLVSPVPVKYVPAGQAVHELGQRISPPLHER